MAKDKQSAGGKDIWGPTCCVMTAIAINPITTSSNRPFPPGLHTLLMLALIINFSTPNVPKCVLPEIVILPT